MQRRGKLDLIEQKLDRMDARMSLMAKRLGETEKKSEDLEQSVNFFSTKNDDDNKKCEEVAVQLKGIVQDLKSTSDEVKSVRSTIDKITTEREVLRTRYSTSSVGQ